MTMNIKIICILVLQVYLEMLKIVNITSSYHN